MNNSILEHVARETELFFMPISERLRSGDISGLMSELGWYWPEEVDLNVSEVISRLDKLVDTLVNLDRDAGIPAYVDALRVAVEIRDAIHAIKNNLPNPDVFSGDTANALRIIRASAELIGQRTVALLVFRYLQTRQTTLLGFLQCVGIIGIIREAPDDAHPGFDAIEIDWVSLSSLFTQPEKILLNLYNWGAATSLKSEEILRGLQFIAMGVGLPTTLTPLPFRLERALLKSLGGNVVLDMGANQLVIHLLDSFSSENGAAQLGVRIMGIPDPKKPHDGPKGITVVPFAEGQTQIRAKISEELHLETQGSFEADFALVVLPGGRVEFLDQLSVTGGIDTTLGITLTHKREEEPLIIVGSADHSRFEYSGSYMTIGLSGSPKDPDFFVEMNLMESSIVVDAGEGDSFLGFLLPTEPLIVPLSMTIGYSSKRGFYFSSSDGFEVTLPVHLNIGPFELETIYIALSFGTLNQTQVHASAAISANGQLGPLVANIHRIGVRAIMSFPEGGGNLGSADVGIGFLPPTGAGLSIDSGAIVGGGFLEFDDPNKRYAGILQLQAGGIELVAIGLITTRMPDGSEGFSLLINIGVVFMPPIELSFAFTLSGVGGLLGYNRRMDVEALRDGLRNKALNSIMFPEDPIANANKIISDLRAVFPPAEGRFVIGPMIKLGWGYPNIIQADIGVFIELPDFARVAVLGQLAVGLPIPEEAIIELHIDVLGVLEVPKQRLSIDATIYDSRIYQYTLTGESALRWSWGDQPVFAMSLGGFHPRFSPPDNFPSLKRLTLNLSQGPDLQLYCKAYQALTSNSVQFGALVDLHASESGATVQGTLMFDALIYFDPFSFAVAISGNVVARYKGEQLASVHITLNLSGPAPWLARGKARFEILVWDVEVGFNERWGPESVIMLDPVDPWPKLQEALNAHANWGSRWTNRIGMVEVLAERKEEPSNPDDPPKPLLLHPAGALEFRQKVLPLGITLDKLGNAPVKNHNRFELPKVKISDVELVSDKLDEDFARGQFTNLSERERLSAPAFEKMTAGVSASSNQFGFDKTWIQCFDSNDTRYRVYESVLIQDDLVAQQPEESNKAKAKLSWMLARKQVAVNAARQSPVRRTARRRFETLGVGKRVSVAAPGYMIVDNDTLQRADIAGNTGSLGRLQAEQLLKAQGMSGAGRTVVASREVTL